MKQGYAVTVLVALAACLLGATVVDSASRESREDKKQDPCSPEALW